MQSLDALAEERGLRFTAADIMVLRAVHHQAGDSHGIASYTGLGRYEVVDVLERLASDGWTVTLDGHRQLTGWAIQRLGTLLWVCRDCGCADELACDGGCAWLAPDACSSCTPAPCTLTTTAAVR